MMLRLGGDSVSVVGGYGRGRLGSGAPIFDCCEYCCVSGCLVYAGAGWPVCVARSWESCVASGIVRSGISYWQGLGIARSAIRGRQGLSGQRGERESRWQSVDAIGCEEVPSAVDHVRGDS